jgi:hypothetical protein
MDSQADSYRWILPVVMMYNTTSCQQISLKGCWLIVPWEDLNCHDRTWQLNCTWYPYCVIGIRSMNVIHTHHEGFHFVRRSVWRLSRRPSWRPFRRCSRRCLTTLLCLPLPFPSPATSLPQDPVGRLLGLIVID